MRHWRSGKDSSPPGPSLARIPAALLDDPSEKARKAVARMGRNYGFDRARYFLPSAALTNVMLIMPARGWVSLCQQLLSHPAPEAVRLGGLIREELALCTPRLLRHAVRRESIAEGLRRELAVASEAARLQEPPSLNEEATVERALAAVPGSVRRRRRWRCIAAAGSGRVRGGGVCRGS